MSYGNRTLPDSRESGDEAIPTQVKRLLFACLRPATHSQRSAGENALCNLLHYQLLR